MNHRDIPTIQGNQKYVKYAIGAAVAGLVLIVLILPSASKQSDSEKKEPVFTVNYHQPPTDIQSKNVEVSTEYSEMNEGQLKVKESHGYSPEELQRISAPITIIKSSSKKESQSEVVLAKAKEIKNPEYTLLQGKIIKAVLETEINSDLPGMIRAIVSEDVYADRGGLVMIPKGSRLVGQYSSNISAGQRRVMVAWSRMIHATKSIEIQFKSPSTDSLGSSGMAGEVDTRFLRRFGEASLMSMISAGAATYKVDPADEYSTKLAYRQSLVDSFADTAGDMLEQNRTVPPTIVVRRGEKIHVFVAQDLDFSEVLPNV